MLSNTPNVIGIHGDSLYVLSANTVGEYNLGGTVIKASLIPGLTVPTGGANYGISVMPPSAAAPSSGILTMPVMDN